VADWEDVQAAVIVGGQAIEAEISSSSNEGPNRQVFQLRLIDGQPARLTAECAAAPSADSNSPPPVEITLSASVGRFGDAAMEAKLLRAVAHRLGALRGVGFAPIK
jgi:hypothetical protein